MVGLAFQPWQGLMGGMAMGVVTAGKLFLTGRVLGISGAIKGLLAGDFSLWRLSFLAGMAGGSLLLGPSYFDVLPPTYTMARAFLGALLVGMGSSLGNGCTSGHGISGNARLSIRSIVFTAIFMVSAMAACILSGTTGALGLSGGAPYLAPTEQEVQAGLGLLVGATTALGAAGFVGRMGKKMEWGSAACKVVDVVCEATAGVTFAVALGSSGMVRPTKVAAFLNMIAPTRDFSLMFVLGGALLMATPLIQLILRYKDIKALRPCCGGDFQVPKSSKIDSQLVAGAVTFGVGWGVCGGCPGPMLVNFVANPGSPVYSMTFMALVFGMFLAKYIAPLFNNETSNTKSE